MTAQEQEMINGLIDRVDKTHLSEKDPDAERLLQQGLGRIPDALYILSQTVLVQQYGLEQAQKQLGDLRAQMEQLQQRAQAPEPKHSTSFLGSLFGGGGSNTAAAPPPPQQAGYGQPPQQAQYAPVQEYAPTPGYGAGPGYGAPGMGGAPQSGGFLRGAMQTAAGVAAGALAFEGVESLLHGFGERETGYGGGAGLGGFGGGERPTEVVNNYYGDDARDSGERRDSGDADDRRDDRDDRDDDDPGSNVFTEGNDRSNFAGDAGGEDDSSFGSEDDAIDDDSGNDDGGMSDDSGFDDSGSDDNSF